MTFKEYEQLKNLNYTDKLAAYKKMNGTTNKNYPACVGTRSNEGLEFHHDGENKIPGLSSTENQKLHKKEQKANHLTPVDKIQHLDVHITAAEETKEFGILGACTWLIPEIKNFYKHGYRNPNINPAFYHVIDNDEYRAIFKDLLKRYSVITKDFEIVMEHNKNVYAQVVACLATLGKALVVLGTGIGKTTTALQYLKDNNCKALVIVPNKLIKSGWEKYPDWCTVVTYSKFSKHYNDGTYDYSKYGLVILDEAHHAGYDELKDKGAKVWSKGINYLIDNKIIKVLGLTGTPERSDEIDVGFSLFKGAVCQGLSIEEAIEQGVAWGFDYVTAKYNASKLYKELKSKYYDASDAFMCDLWGQLDLDLNNTPTLKAIMMKYSKQRKIKGIIFIQEIDDKETAMKIIKETYPEMTDKIKAIDSKMDEDSIIENREWFEKTDEGFLVAVNMISEGAHYKGVNTLIMFRRTNSYLVYSQQIGRIITLMKYDNPEAIVFDFVNNIDNVELNDWEEHTEGHSHSGRSSFIKALKSRQYIVADETRNIVEDMKRIKNRALTKDKATEEYKDLLRQNFTKLGPQGILDLMKK